MRPHAGPSSGQPGVHRAMATYPAAHGAMGARPGEAGHARPGAASFGDRARTAPGEGARGAAAGRPAEAGRHEARMDPSHDPRVGGHAATNTRGEARALPPPRPFLHAEAHRDPASDRAMVARHAADFHSHNVRDFTPRERVLWQSGSWHNEWHYGRRGWWWEADGIWYPYALPIFPYPLEVADVVVYDTPFVDGPDLTYAEGVADDAAPPPAGLPDIPPLPPAPPGWYRCDTPSGYYPDLALCTVTWVRLPDPPAPGEQ